MIHAGEGGRQVCSVSPCVTFADPDLILQGRRVQCLPEMQHRMIQGHVAVLLAAGFFGLMSPVAKVVMWSGTVDGSVLATLRIGGSALLFWLVSFFAGRDRREHIRRRDWPALVAMSLCGMALNQYCFVVGVQYTSPTNACVIATSTPVMTMALAALVLHERLSARKILGLVLGAAGALTLVLGSSGGCLGGSPEGDLLCLASQFFASCYFVFFGRVIRRYSTVTIMKWLFTVSTVLSVPFMAFPMVELPWERLTAAEWLGAAYVVGVGTFLCYILLIVAQRRLKPPVVAMYNYVQPVVAATAGICWGVDVLTFPKFLAVLLIAAGVWFVTRSSGAPYHPAPQKSL